MTKFIAIAGALLVPFIIIWVTAGFLWAILAYFVFGGITLMAFVGARRRRRIYYVDDYDEEIVVTRRPTPYRSNIQRGVDWHVPKVNKKGVEFITGARSLRKVQKDAMRRTKRNLWG